MKSKNFNKKLMLNKKTVANLGSNEMRDIQGGADTCTCKTCVSTYLACETTVGFPYTVCDSTCLSLTGTPQSDPCCM
jgi:natural product precursor